MYDYLGNKTYAGMPEFFKAAESYTQGLHILSASPSVLSSKIANTLNNHGIKYKSLLLRSDLLESKLTYKIRRIKKLMNASQDDFLFIGDDIGKDPEAYLAIRNLYPSRVLAIYIHVVSGRPVDRVTRYWTSFDLALGEFDANRMPPEKIEEMAKKLLSEKNLFLIFPRKAQCPTLGTPWEWQTRTIFMEEAFKLAKSFNHFCQVR